MDFMYTWESGSTRRQFGSKAFRCALRFQSNQPGGPLLRSPSVRFLLPLTGPRVQVENNGVLEYIAVKPGLSAHGYVEVTPLEGKLSPGRLVVVGYNSQANKELK